MESQTSKLRGQKTIMIGLSLAVMIACLDSTIVSTCGPVIVNDLGGESIYSWILTAYLLCETIMIPISGKLSDIYGRKPFLAIGLILFACGSIAVSLCSEMEPFILCRAVQGLGGGILIPVATAAVGDIYEIGSRAKMMGVLGAVYGIGSGMGPLIGGFITEYTTWHWAFYINIPLAMICALLILKSYPTIEPDKSARIDYFGIAILSAFLLDILLLMEWGGDEVGWVSAECFAMLAIAVVLIAIFVRVERRASEPVLAPHLLKNTVVVQTAFFMFITGLALMGASTYISFFGIDVLGFSVLEAGEYAMAMVFGMIITSVASGGTVYRTGFRIWLTIGPIMSFAGLLMMSTINVDTTIPWILASLFVFGLGLGCVTSIVLTAVQNSAEPSEIGMTTSAVNMIRNIGSTMGTAVFAAIINNGILTRLSGLVPGTISQELFDMLPHDTGIVVAAKLPGMEMFKDALIGTFVDSVDIAFIFAAVLIVLLVPIGMKYKAAKP